MTTDAKDRTMMDQTEARHAHVWVCPDCNMECIYQGGEEAKQERINYHYRMTHKVDQVLATQPAPDAGEWRVEHFTKDGADEWMVVTGIGRTVALANVNDSKLAEAEMRQIVHDHVVARQVEQLVEALKGVAIMLNTKLEQHESEPWVQRVRAALSAHDTAVKEERG